MPRFTFDTPRGPRAVRAPDEATARAYLESLINHPDPNKRDDQPYTSARLNQLRSEREARAALLTLRAER